LNFVSRDHYIRVTIFHLNRKSFHHNPLEDYAVENGWKRLDSIAEEKKPKEKKSLNRKNAVKAPQLEVSKNTVFIVRNPPMSYAHVTSCLCSQNLVR
jgi:hypothetical protein